MKAVQDTAWQQRSSNQPQWCVCLCDCGSRENAAKCWQKCEHYLCVMTHLRSGHCEWCSHIVALQYKGLVLDLVRRKYQTLWFNIWDYGRLATRWSLTVTQSQSQSDWTEELSRSNACNSKCLQYKLIYIRTKLANLWLCLIILP